LVGILRRVSARHAEVEIDGRTERWLKDDVIKERAASENTSVGCCSYLKESVDWFQVWAAHTVCCFLQFPCVEKNIVNDLSPWKMAMDNCFAKISGTRVAIRTWPTRLHFLCDSNFGAHALLPWRCLCKVFVVFLQVSVWCQRKDGAGTAQLLLKILVTVWSFYRLLVVVWCRTQLAKTLVEGIRGCDQIPGVEVVGRRTKLTPASWRCIPANSTETRIELAERNVQTKRIEAYYNGIFRPHFCPKAPISAEADTNDSYVIEDYIFWADVWRSLLGWHSMSPLRGVLSRVLTSIVLILVFLKYFHEFVQ